MTDEITKDIFYDQLQAELEEAPQHDMKIIMGDLNAKEGSNNKNYEKGHGEGGLRHHE